jgi:hypothetical protein
VSLDESPDFATLSYSWSITKLKRPGSACYDTESSQDALADDFAFGWCSSIAELNGSRRNLF